MSLIFNCSDLTLDSRVALKRDVVEDMLIQRFNNRIHGVSDDELAQITERLLSEQATFPTDLLLISPSTGQQQQERPRQQALPPPPRKVTIDPTSKSEVEQEEEDDDTADLFATLGNVAADGAAGAAASTVSDAITNNWAPQIPRIVKAVVIGAGFAATVPVGAAIQRRMTKKDSIGGGDGGSNSIENKINNGQATETESKKETGGIGGFLSWIFGDDVVVETQPETINSQAASANNANKTSTSSSNDPSTNAGAVATDAAVQMNEEQEGSSYSGDQVLWKRKDTTDSQQPINGNSTSASSGGVLWRRNEKMDEDDSSNSSSNQQQDLWRVPIEALRSPANGEDGGVRPPQVPKRKKAIAPSPRSVPVVEKRKIVDGVLPKLSESALDNAEPPDFVANGVHKL